MRAHVNTDNMQTAKYAEVHHMRRAKMPTNVRLSMEEQEALRKKCIDINKMLVKMGMQPLRDSEVVHAVLAQAIEKIEVSASGKLVMGDA
jgi:hypothetical protein